MTDSLTDIITSLKNSGYSTEDINAATQAVFTDSDEVMKVALDNIIIENYGYMGATEEETNILNKDVDALLSDEPVGAEEIRSLMESAYLAGKAAQ
jgi:hypothetical protein